MTGRHDPTLHPLDRATCLTRLPDGALAGRTDPAYANMVGPFGGLTAAIMLNAAMIHPDRLGDPVALTVNYAGAVADGEFRIEAVPMRTNRSTQHWSIVATQGDQVTTTATAFFALRRETWASTETGFPQVPPAASLPSADNSAFATWTRCYDMRFVRGPLPRDSGPAEAPDSVSTMWIRDEPPRPIDFVSLAAICDSFFPRVMIRRPRRVPAGTVSITTYFHADSKHLARVGEKHVLATAHASRFGLGYHDQSAEIWSEGGELLATSHQVVYFKE